MSSFFQPTLLRLVIGCLLALGTSLTALAQEARSDRVDSLGWSGSVAGTAIVQTGNLIKTALVVTADVAYTWQKIGLLWLGNLAYSNKISGLPIEREYLSAIAVRLLPQRRIYPLLLGTVEKSRLRAINLRWNLGAGVSYHVVESRQTSLRTSLLLITETSNYVTNSVLPAELGPGLTSRTEFGYMVRMRGEHRFVHERILLIYNALFQSTFNDPSDYRWAIYANIDVPISRRVALRSVVQYGYERYVVNGTYPDNFLYTGGLSLRL